MHAEHKVHRAVIVIINLANKLKAVQRSRVERVKPTTTIPIFLLLDALHLPLIA